MSLPEPEPALRERSRAVRDLVAAAIVDAGGWLSFARYMELVLYAPGLGYYSGGKQVFGAAGDFVTAPEISPLFGAALARQVAELLAGSAAHVVEVGAGSGALAADLLLALERQGALPESYRILDLSGTLRARQRETLATRAAHLMDRIEWIDAIPAAFSGVVIANELLDATPVHLLVSHEHGLCERGVALGADGAFVWQDKPAGEGLAARVHGLGLEGLPHPYVIELGLAASGWVATWAEALHKGALVLIDYGFPRREYYHPQRADGTLMCHYRHHAHADPFHLPGLCDITAHVDFTAIAEAGVDAGLELLGYTTQSHFLVNCGILGLLGNAGDPQDVAYFRLASGVQKLLGLSEMGELFKVMVLGRGIDTPLQGFARGDHSHTL